jgi:anti-anti-sigma factor
MAIDCTDESNNLRRIIISGRLDVPGTEGISAKFAELTATTERRVVVDLTAVNFLASVGIRALIINAKALQSRGGKMVLLVGDNIAAVRTLEATGIDALIPIFDDSAEATRAALA